MDYVAKWNRTVIWRDLPLMAKDQERHYWVTTDIFMFNQFRKIANFPTSKEIAILKRRNFLHASASEMQFTEVSAVQKGEPASE